MRARARAVCDLNAPSDHPRAAVEINDRVIVKCKAQTRADKAAEHLSENVGQQLADAQAAAYKRKQRNSLKCVFFCARLQTAAATQSPSPDLRARRKFEDQFGRRRRARVPSRVQRQLRYFSGHDSAQIARSR